MTGDTTVPIDHGQRIGILIWVMTWPTYRCGGRFFILLFYSKNVHTFSWPCRTVFNSHCHDVHVVKPGHCYPNLTHANLHKTLLEVHAPILLVATSRSCHRCLRLQPEYEAAASTVKNLGVRSVIPLKVEVTRVGDVRRENAWTIEVSRSFSLDCYIYNVLWW